MGQFRLDSIDWDQSGGGTPHAIADLQQQLPVNAVPHRTMPGPDRPDYVACVLERPIRYRPAADFDWSRTQEEFRRTDDQGPHLLVSALVVCAHFAGQQLHAGMRSLAVAVAYVIDNTLASDEQMSFTKCDYIGTGQLTEVTGLVDQ